MGVGGVSIFVCFAFFFPINEVAVLLHYFTWEERKNIYGSAGVCRYLFILLFAFCFVLCASCFLLFAKIEGEELFKPRCKPFFGPKNVQTAGKRAKIYSFRPADPFRVLRIKALTRYVCVCFEGGEKSRWACRSKPENPLQCQVKPTGVRF